MKKTTAAKLFYLLQIKSTKNATYYSAFEHTPVGLEYVGPSDSTDPKAAQKEGFFYTQSKRTLPVAYAIRITEHGTNNSFLAAKQLEKILKNQGRNVDFLKVAELQTTTPHVYYENTPPVRVLSIHAVTYWDNANGNPYYFAIYKADGKEIGRHVCGYGSYDESSLKSDALNILTDAGAINARQEHEWEARTGIQIKVYAEKVKTLAACRKGPQ